MVYALQPITGGPVKIGTTENLPVRISQLEAHYRQPLALLATFPGGRDEERAVHERFAHLRLGRTEQFQPAADLMAFLGRPLLVGANPEAIEALAAGTNVRITKRANELAREAGAITGEGIAAYVDRIVIERAEADLLEKARRRVKEAESAEAKKKGKPSDQ